MLAYLEKHPDEPPKIWRPVDYRRKAIMSDWCFIQDNFGRSIAGRVSKLEIGKTFELWSCYVDGWNGRTGTTVKMFATVLKRVSMQEAIRLARAPLRHKPFCYEVIVD